MLTIEEEKYEQLRRQGEEAYPQECCGVMVGEVREGEWRVARVVGCQNTRADRAEDRYAIDPRELLKIQREANDEGMQIIGFYHSHPDHPAQWSKTDLEEAHWIDCCYVITAVEKGKAATTRAFLLCGTGEEDKRFEEERFRVEGKDI